MPESQLIVATMMDLQNLRELGKEGGEGAGERYFSSLLPSPFLFPLA